MLETTLMQEFYSEVKLVAGGEKWLTGDRGRGGREFRGRQEHLVQFYCGISVPGYESLLQSVGESIF